MQKDYQDSIRRFIEQYKAIDLTAIFKEKYPDEPDLTAVQLGQYSGATFISLGNHAMSSLETAMDAPYWHALPASLPGHNEFGQVDINSVLSSFVSQVAQKQLPQASQQLPQVIWYCMSTGIWLDDKATQPPTKTELKSLSDQLAANAKRIEGQLETIKSTTSELTSSRQDLVKFTEEKKNELAEIRRLLGEAQQHMTELSTILTKANTNNTSISGIDENAKKTLEELKVQLGVVTKGYEEFKASTDKLRAEINEDREETAASLATAEELRQTIFGHKEEIERYLGMSVDGYLGNKFDGRAEKLKTALKAWQWLVPISTVVAVIWVVVVFTCLRTELSSEWASLGINLLKTSPAFILMGFVFGQYGKERNLQEEYAFKGAVAMTINVYADLLAGKDDETNKSRQQLILNALKQVHTQPKLYSERGGTLISVKAREMRETMGVLNETLKNMKP